MRKGIAIIELAINTLFQEETKRTLLSKLNNTGHSKVAMSNMRYKPFNYLKYLRGTINIPKHSPSSLPCFLWCTLCALRIALK